MCDCCSGIVSVFVELFEFWDIVEFLLCVLRREIIYLINYRLLKRVWYSVGNWGCMYEMYII